MFFKNKIAQVTNIDWAKDEILGIDRVNDAIEVSGNKVKYLAKQAFDGQVDKIFDVEKIITLHFNN